MPKYAIDYMFETPQILVIRWAGEKISAQKIYHETGKDAIAFLQELFDDDERIVVNAVDGDTQRENVYVYLDLEYNDEGEVVGWHRRFCYINGAGTYLSFLMQLASGKKVSLYDA